jgi:uncharacterized protein (DUF58 family)
MWTDLSQLRSRLAARARRWARQRQGADPPRLALASERLYILPTPAGLVYGVMLVTMLAGAMNYNNNLAFGLTFLLAGIGIVAIYRTHRNLCGLRLHYLGAEPVYAGEPLVVRFSLVNDAGESRDEIFLDWNDCDEIAGGVAALDSRTVGLPLATARRGPLALPALRLTTRAPLGLMRAWAWVHLDSRPVVYPRPAPAVPIPLARDGVGSDDGARHDGDDDLAGLRDYRAGDSPRRIAWKSYARTGNLLAREFRGGNDAEPVWLDWDAVPATDTESRVALLARLVLDAAATGCAWGLRLPGTRIGPGRGREHLHRSLLALAITHLPP